MDSLLVHASTPYSILIDFDLLSQSGPLILSHLDKKPERAVIVTDSNVAPLYLHTVQRSLEAKGVAVTPMIFGAGESSKRLKTVAQMYSVFSQAGLTRTDIAVALGGGVTGDMCGFAAASYMRGIRYIQIPTTLLSQIDSSVGGKTAIDIDEGTNLVGAFWNPALVLCDIGTLSTLTPHFFADGMAEAIKYGCIKSLSLFEQLEKQNASDFLPDMISQCIRIKCGVVERDERESGERMLLNFGHTLGHALEKYYHYEGLSHGEAVGIGMVLASRAGEALGITPAGTADRIAALLQKYHLPTSDPAPLGTLAKFALSDKKRLGSTVNFVALKTIGDAFVHPVPQSQWEAFVLGGASR